MFFTYRANKCVQTCMHTYIIPNRNPNFGTEPHLCTVSPCPATGTGVVYLDLRDAVRTSS